MKRLTDEIKAAAVHYAYSRTCPGYSLGIDSAMLMELTSHIRFYLTDLFIQRVLSSVPLVKCDIGSDNYTSISIIFTDPDTGEIL